MSLRNWLWMLVSLMFQDHWVFSKVVGNEFWTQAVEFHLRWHRKRSSIVEDYHVESSRKYTYHTYVNVIQIDIIIGPSISENTTVVLHSCVTCICLHSKFFPFRQNNDRILNVVIRKHAKLFLNLNRIFQPRDFFVSLNQLTNKSLPL